MKIKGTIFIVSAPSGAGKTSLIKALIESMPKIGVAISHTTRPIRPGEIHAKHYYFIEKSKFKAMHADGDFVEDAEVFDHYYGTSKHELDRFISNGIDVLLDIDWQGAESIAKLYPKDSVSVYILPPSNESLRHRLETRGQDSKSVIDKRMNKAKSEIMHYESFQYLLVNDDFADALERLKAIVLSFRLRLVRQRSEHKILLKELLA